MEQGRPHTAYLGLGSNLGDRAGFIAEALARLRDAGVEIRACSQIYETEPVGMESDLPFYNCVCEVRTALDPRGLLHLLLEIETGMGRDRTRGMDREIDLDLLHFHGVVVDEPGLHLPHPRLHLRRFVMEPWAEIAPGLVLPLLNTTVRALAASLSGAGSPWIRPTGMNPFAPSRPLCHV